MTTPTRLLNRSAVRDCTLDTIKQERAHLADKFTRVSSEFFVRADAHMRQWINEQIRIMPTSGKTIR